MRNWHGNLSPFGDWHTGRVGQFSPRLLFASGEQGVWFEPSPTTCFTDTTRTTPASVGQAVAGMTDLSGRGNHATQSITSARPILGRVPASGRRNLLVQTEAIISLNGWTINGTGVVKNYPSESVDGIEVSRTVTGLGFSVSFTRNVALTGATAGLIFTGQIRARSVSGPTQVRLVFIETGGANADEQTNITDLNLTSDFQTFTITRTINRNDRTAIRFFMASDTTGDYVVDFVKPQLELGSTATPYQRVGSTFDVTEAGQPDNFYLSFDGIDDFLSIASFDPAFDKVQVFAGVRKLSDANRASIVTGPDLSDYTFSLESPGFANAYEFANIMSALRRAGSTGAAPDTSILTAIGDFDLPTLANPLTQLRRNGVIAETNTGSLGATAGNYKAGVYTIGCREGTSQFLNGQVYSLVMRFGANLSLPTIERTEKYVASKTAGVTLP
jgi:hypothetical protein